MLMMTEVKENKEGGKDVRPMARGQQGGVMAQDAVELKLEAARPSFGPTGARGIRRGNLGKTRIN